MTITKHKVNQDLYLIFSLDIISLEKSLLTFYSYVLVLCVLGFPGGSDSKEFACNAGDLGSIPGLARSPGGGHGSPLRYSCLEDPHGQRSLPGYSPWGHKKSDMTE